MTDTEGRLLLEDFVDPMAFFQGVHDAPSLRLAANTPGQVRLRPRASSLADCARSIAHDMAGSPLTNPQYGDPAQVAQQYANEQGRMSEALSFTALEWQPNRKYVLVVVSQQVELAASSPVSGHPDGELVWFYSHEESTDFAWNGAGLAGIPEERFYFTPEMFGREGTGRFKVGVEHKHPGVNTYGRVLKNGLREERPGWVVQAVMYGKDRGWDYVLLIDIALDATAVKSRGMGFTKYLNDDPLRAKANFELLALRDITLLWYPDLKQRADDLAAHFAAGGSPDDIRREFTGKGTFPCGYCEVRDRCNAHGDGIVVITPMPDGLRAS